MGAKVHHSSVRTVFVFHGIQGSPEENWFPWLKDACQDTRGQAPAPACPAGRLDPERNVPIRLGYRLAQGTLLLPTRPQAAALQSKGEKEGYAVFVPAFPNPDQPQLSEWLEHFTQYEKHVNERSIFVGHSLGVAFALNVLERLERPIRASFFVAPVFAVMENEFDPLMKSFVERGFPWEKIRKNCQQFHVFQSDNDPYIRQEQAEELAAKLEASIHLVPGAGHFNTAAGYTSFPLLLEQLKNML